MAIAEGRAQHGDGGRHHAEGGGWQRQQRGGESPRHVSPRREGGILGHTQTRGPGDGERYDRTERRSRDRNWREDNRRLYGDRNWDRQHEREWRRNADRTHDRYRDNNRDRDWRREGYRHQHLTWDRDRDDRWRDRDRRDGHREWDRRWRDNNRYDWERYRYSHRDRYRLQRYRAPHGYEYRRWNHGYRLDPWYYSRSYWISDPYYYRLPPAYGRYRWVRYYDDVILVDIASGVIVDIIYSFFW